MDLGTITNLQRMNGVRFAAFDDGTPNHQVADFNGLQLTSDQPGAVSFANIMPDPAAVPPGSAFFADVIGVAPSTGLVTITADGQQKNFGAHFTTPVTLTVILDPSLPGLPTHWVVTPGTIIAK